VSEQPNPRTDPQGHLAAIRAEKLAERDAIRARHKETAGRLNVERQHRVLGTLASFEANRVALVEEAYLQARAGRLDATRRQAAKRAGI
jgi:hypothetical protein